MGGRDVRKTNSKTGNKKSNVHSFDEREKDRVGGQSIKVGADHHFALEPLTSLKNITNKSFYKVNILHQKSFLSSFHSTVSKIGYMRASA